MNVSHLRQYVQLDHQLRKVFIELFLYNFIGRAYGPSQNHVLLSAEEYARNTAGLFASTDALNAAVQTLKYNRASTDPALEISPGGFLYYPPGHDAAGTFASFPKLIWPRKEGEGVEVLDSAFDTLRELIKIGRENNIDLIFVLTPNHAYDDYYLDTTDSWKVVEEWLSRLSKEDATIYSFSQPNAWVYEPVRAGMRKWYDPYHFSLEMGRAMQLAMVGQKGDELPDDFMVRLTPAMVSKHVNSRRQAIRHWKNHYPAFAIEFERERQNWQLALNAPGQSGKN